MRKMRRKLNYDWGIGFRKILKEKKMTQGEIFRRTGIERAYLSRFASGKVKHPRLETIIRIAEAMEVSLEEFVAKSNIGDES